MKIKTEELIKEIIGETKNFPIYTTQILNLANQNAQGTRPSVVGQMSDLIQQCPFKDYKGWEKWYLSKKPKAIDEATEKVFSMVKKLKEAINLIDENMVRKWIRDLVVDKTYIGMRFQETILKRVAKLKNTNYRLSTAQEESQNIDGFIGKRAVSIKPITYKVKADLKENINVPIIYYEKKKDGIVVDISELD